MNIVLIYKVLRKEIGAAITPNHDGTYTILVNRNYCRDKQIKAILHEMRHITNGDFDADLHASLLENMMHQQDLNTAITMDVNFFVVA